MSLCELQLTEAEELAMSEAQELAMSENCSPVTIEYIGFRFPPNRPEWDFDWNRPEYRFPPNRPEFYFDNPNNP